MKRALTVLIIVGFVLPSAISMFLASNAQPTQTANKISSLESNPGNAGNNATSRCDSAGTERTLENDAFSGEQPQPRSDPTTPPPTNPGASPPDGAIYYGGEPPYAYIPTYDPREKGFPKIPLEPEA